MVIPTLVGLKLSVTGEPAGGDACGSIIQFTNLRQLHTNRKANRDEGRNQ